MKAFDENGDDTLTAREKAVLFTSLAVNNDHAVNKVLESQKIRLPMLQYFGACGRIQVFAIPGKSKIKESNLRLYLQWKIIDSLRNLFSPFFKLK